MAKERKMQVIIFNPNERIDPISKEEINDFSSMEKHCKYVWQELIGKMNSSNEIFVIAHSMGGFCMTEIMSEEIYRDKIRKIAFTDSVHGCRMKLCLNKQKNLYHRLKNVIDKLL